MCVFRSLFQNSPAVKNDVFHLSIQDVGGIGQILDYMYTSHLELNPDNAHTLLNIAQSLQVQQVIVVGCVPKCIEGYTLFDYVVLLHLTEKLCETPGSKCTFLFFCRCLTFLTCALHT